MPNAQPKISIVVPPSSEALNGGQLLGVLMDYLGFSAPDLTTALTVRRVNSENAISLATIQGWRSRGTLPKPHHKKLLYKVIRDFSIDSDIADSWCDAFARAWINTQIGSEFEANNSTVKWDKILRLHKEWITERYHRPLMDENFSIDEIYVPLRLIAFGVESGLTEISDIHDPDILCEFGSFSETEARFDSETQAIFIKGGPGSGKSVQALKLANDLAEQKSLCVIFVQLSRSKAGREFDFIVSRSTPKIDDRFDPLSFVSAFKESSFKKACIVIDGLDEIGSQTAQSTFAVVENLLLSIREQIEDLSENHQKLLRVVAFGRETITQAIAQKSILKSRLYSMGSLSGRFHNQPTADPYGEDVRALWWERFCKARGYPAEAANQIPNFLHNEKHVLHEIGTEPLLAYLICWIGLRRDYEISNEDTPCILIDKKINLSNRNEIYNDILSEVLSSQRWRKDATGPIIYLTEQRFKNVLQHIALASWQNGSRSAGIDSIRQIIGESNHTRDAFEALVRIDDQDSGAVFKSNLITAFYYRITEDLEKGTLEPEFEFTHRTFSEYLLATFVFESFIELIELYRQKTVTTEQKLTALSNWVELVIAGELEDSFGKFLIDEGETIWREMYNPSREQRPTLQDWQPALSIVQDLLHRPLDLRATAERNPQIFDTQISMSRAIQIVLVCWNSFARAYWSMWQKRVKVDEGFPPFEIATLKTIAQAPFTKSEGSIGEIPLPDTPCFTGYYLSALDLDEADLSQLWTNGGDILGMRCSNVHMPNSIWHNVKISYSDFLNVLAPCSVFSDTYFDTGTFEGGVWQGVEFHFAIFNTITFRNINFKRCQFINCTFINCEAFDTKFDMCSFSNVALEFNTDNVPSFRRCEFDADTAQEDNFIFDNCFESEI